MLSDFTSLLMSTRSARTLPDTGMAKVFCLAGAGPPPNTGAAASLPPEDHAYYIARVDLRFLANAIGNSFIL